MRLLDRTEPPTAAATRESWPGRVLVLLGAAALALGTVLPWVDVAGVPLKLDWLGLQVPRIGREVAGTDTAAWPFVLGFAAVVALLALAGRARRLVLGLGLVSLVGSGGLLYYLSNVIEIETSGRSAVEQTLAQLAIRSSVQVGPYVLLTGAALIVAGALMRGPGKRR